MSGCQGVVTALAQVQEQTGKIHAAHGQADRRHQNVVDEGTDDFAECAADDDAHRHIDHVASHGEVSEFFKHYFSPICEMTGCPGHDNDRYRNWDSRLRPPLAGLHYVKRHRKEKDLAVHRLLGAGRGYPAIPWLWGVGPLAGAGFGG